MWNQVVKRILGTGSAGLFILSLLLNLGLLSISRADVIPGLYAAQIPVSTQNTAERKEALTAGMRQVLLRVSGHSIVLTITAIEEALAHPTRYMQRYRYRNREGASSAHKMVLWVRFDKHAINKLLRDSGMPVWGRTRPAVLVWMVVDNRRSRILLGNDVSNPAKTFISEQARLRGIPLRWPLLDLSDRANITTSDVWGSFEDTIINASRRYHTEAILVGRVYKTYDGSWNARWTLYNHGQREDWNAHAETLIEALMPGVDRSAGILAQRFASIKGDEQNEPLLLQVYGVNTLAAYNKTLKYLSRLAVVTDIKPQIVSPDNVIFRLKVRNGRQAVSQAIALGHTLVARAVQSQPAAQGVAASPVSGQPVATVRSDLSYYLVQ